MSRDFDYMKFPGPKLVDNWVWLVSCSATVCAVSLLTQIKVG